MKFMHTASGVLAIVGLGYLAGVGQSMLSERPIILGATSPAAQPTTRPADLPTDDQPFADNPITDSTDDNSTEANSNTQIDTQNDANFDALLDAPVPEGMITLREAFEHWNEGAYFVDARHDYEFEAGRISGAAHLTAETIFTDAGEAEMQSIPPDAAVVIYCVGGEECDASHNTLALMQSFGYTNLMIMGVGYEEWNAAGLPIDSGVSP